MKCKILLLSVFVSITLAGNGQTDKKPITLEDIWKNYTFYAKGIRGLKSMNDGEHYTTIEKGTAIVKYKYKTGELVDTIISVSRMANPLLKAIPNYEFDNSETKILIYINDKELYRRSFTADYYVYDLKLGKLISVSDNGQQRLASFSPDGTKVAFIRDNNLFLKNLTDLSETQLTTDGKFNEVINGAPDWVYEEEFGMYKAFEWSPDGKFIAFIRFDESNVKEYSMLYYKASFPEFPENSLYPKVYTYKYPKAGENNSLVSVRIFSVEGKTTKPVDLGTETDIYVPRILWTSQASQLAVLRLNRLQNKMELLLANAHTGESRVVFTETNKYYVDENDFDNLEFTADGKGFFLTSELDGYRHIYYYSMEGKLINQLTKGNYDVVDFYGFDSKRKLVFYSAALPAPSQRSLYSVKLDGSKNTRLFESNGTSTAFFSSTFSYFVNRFSNVTTPARYSLHQSDGKEIRILEDNQKLKDTLQYYRFSTKEFFSFKTSENVELNGYMIKPFGFDLQKKYPVLLTQYSGPASQEVKDQWSVDWEDVLAAQGYIVVCVDGRGTGYRGEEFRKMTYMQLGKYETIDQIETAKYLKKQSFVDSARIGIWGWSYGGFMTLLCMTKGAEHFKAGIAVAPVTNWRYYDNIYTERFMRTPQENPDGYDQNSPINFASQLNGNLLIVHGDADDNVHPQNTMEMVDKLVQSEKLFEMAIYPNRNHSIYGGNTRYQLFKRMNDFILRNL